MFPIDKAILIFPSGSNSEHHTKEARMITEFLFSYHPWVFVIELHGYLTILGIALQ